MNQCNCPPCKLTRILTRIGIARMISLLKYQEILTRSLLIESENRRKEINRQVAVEVFNLTGYSGAV